MSAAQTPGAQVNRGLAWVALASSLVSVLDVVAILLVLGFWVPAEQYGVATLAAWLFPILDQVTDLGLSAAVVQRDHHDDDAISTVFWINLSLGLVLFGLIALGAPVLASRVYRHPIVGSLLIAYGTKLIFQNAYFIPQSLMRRELRFKELSVIRICANLAEFAGKVGFAAAGFGIWCFVLGPLCRIPVTSIGCQICRPWRPRLVLRLGRAWSYTAFGIKSAGSQILFYFYTNVDYPIVAASFGAAALGVYKLAYEIALEPVRLISNVVVDIAFPTFARLRHDREALIAQFVAFVRLNLVTVLLYASVVFVIAGDLASVFFPGFDGLAGAVRILCAVAVLRSVSFVMPPLLDGSGHPTRTFAYMVTAAIALPLSFWGGAHLLGDWLGFRSVAVAWAVGYPIAFAVLVMLVVYTLDLPLRRFLRAVAGVPACAIASAAVGLVAELGLGAAPVALRMVASATAIVLGFGLLLAYTQGLSLRGALRALRSG